MLKNRRYVHITLPHELADWLEKQAEIEYTTKGRLVEKVLDEYREKHCHDEKS
mgnify:CR=1 FL=1|jgi:hypothetical protein